MDATAWFGPLVASPAGPVHRDAPATLGAALRRAAERWPDRPALEDGGMTPARWRYAELDAAVDHAVATLVDRGLGPGRPLVGLLTDGACLAALPFVASRLGRPVVLAPTAHADPALARLVAAAQPAAVLADAATRPRAERLVAWWDEASSAHAASRPPVLAAPLGCADRVRTGRTNSTHPGGVEGAEPNGPGDDVVWLATSGSTGTPKLVRLTERGLVSAAAGYLDVLPLGDAERSLAVMPLTYVGPLTAQTVLLPLIGGCLVIAGDRTPGAVADRLAADRITHLDAVPTWLARAADRLRRPAPAWRSLVYGGSAAPAELVAGLARAQPQLALLDAWGLAEASGPVAARRADRDPDRCAGLPETSHDDAAAAGAWMGPWRGVTVRAVDHTGQPVTAALGELQVAGASVTPGYVGRRATDADGWLPTGDLGVVAADGAVGLRGRRRDVVLRGDATVASTEVEHVLRGVDGVADVAVLAVADPVAGEAVAAVVVTEPGSEVDPAALRAHARAELGPAAVPRTVVWRDALPLGATGKVDKEALRAELDR